MQASKGKQTKTFYTMPEYESWKESLGGTTRGWRIKYYKGLGTSTSTEAKEYFADIDRHRKKFVWSSEWRQGPAACVGDNGVDAACKSRGNTSVCPCFSHVARLPAGGGLMELCVLPVSITDDNDGQAIEMAFSKKTVEDRKTWLSNYVPGTFLNMAGETVSYTDFVNKVRWLRTFLLPASCYSSMGSSVVSRSW